MVVAGRASMRCFVNVVFGAWFEGKVYGDMTRDQAKSQFIEDNRALSHTGIVGDGRTSSSLLNCVRGCCD